MFCALLWALCLFQKLWKWGTGWGGQLFSAACNLALSDDSNLWHIFASPRGAQLHLIHLGISCARAVPTQSTSCGTTDWLAHRWERARTPGREDGYVWGRARQRLNCLHFPLREPFTLDNRRPLLLLFLPLVELVICLLAPPGQRGGSETQILFIWLFSSFNKGLMGWEFGDPG